MKKNYSKAVFYIIFTYLAFSTCVLIIARQPYDLHPLKIFYFEALFSAMFLSPWIIAQGRSIFVTSQFKIHLVRALLRLGSALFYFSSLRLIPTVDAMLLKNTVPFFIPIFTYIVSREKVSKSTMFLILIGLYGVYLIVGPFDSNFTVAHVFPLFAAAGYACVALAVHRLLKHDTHAQVVISLNLIVAIFLTPIIFLTWNGMPPGAWKYLIGLGAAFSIGQYSFVQAYSLANPTLLAPFMYLEVLFAFIFLNVLFGVTLSLHEVLGGGVIISSMLIMFWLNRDRKEEESFD